MRKSRYSFINLSEKSTRFRKLQDFYFVESCASNTQFDILRNDGMSNVYLAVQNKDLKVSIRSIDVNDESVIADTVVMDVKLLDGTDKVTVFGSDLSDDGILWLAVFNQNKVIGLDLSKKELRYQFDNIPCPNDLCLSTEHPHIIYVAAGEALNIDLPDYLSSKKGSYEELAVAPVFGQIFEINTKDGIVKNTNTSGLGTLSGIGELNHTIVVSELYDIKTIKTNTFFRRRMRPVKAWQGTCVGDGLYCYLSDNVTRWDDCRAAVSIYRRVLTPEVEAMEHSYISLIGWSICKALTCLYNCFTGAPNELNNAELMMSLSTADVFENVCFLILDTHTNLPYHFRLDNTKLNIPPDVEFDGHATHVQHHANKIIFVNFKSDHILIMDDAEVVDILSRPPVS